MIVIGTVEHLILGMDTILPRSLVAYYWLFGRL